MIEFVNASKIKATIRIDFAAATGSRDVKVTNPGPGGGTATLENAFTVINPVPFLDDAVANTSPPSGARGAPSLEVTISGGNFIEGVSSVEGLAVDGIMMTDIRFEGSSPIVVTINIASDAVLGPRMVKVRNAGPGGGLSTHTLVFTVTM